MHTDLRVHVGTDIESVAEVASSLERWGLRYARRVFTDSEIATCDGPAPSAAPRLTARFAAKEAVMKLLSPTATVPRWRCIEVRTAPNGAPSVHLRDEAADLARERGIASLSVSLSHAAGFATATVVATSKGTEEESDG